MSKQPTLALRVSNPARSIEFYVDRVCFELIEGLPSSDTAIIRDAVYDNDGNAWSFGRFMNIDIRHAFEHIDEIREIRRVHGRLPAYRQKADAPANSCA